VVTGEVGLIDPFDTPRAALEGRDLTTAGIGEMLPGVLSPLLWQIDRHLVEEAFSALLHELKVLRVGTGGTGSLLCRVHGRVAMDFSHLASMAGALPGAAADELEAEYFGSRRRSRHVSAPSGRGHGALRRAAHDVRVLRSRQRAGVQARIVVSAARGLRAARADAALLADAGARVALARHTRLLDLAARGMAAELAVAADATASYRRLQLLLARILGSEAAGRAADEVVARVGVASTPSRRASAAVFAGPTWEELGRAPGGAVESGDAEATSRELAAALARLHAELAQSPRFDPDRARSKLQWRAIRRAAREATERLALREATKAALLEIGGEVRRVHLAIGTHLAATGALHDAHDIELCTFAELRRAVLANEVAAPEMLDQRRAWLQRQRMATPLPARFSGAPEPETAPGVAAARLEGWAASPGLATGRACVVLDPLDEIEAGSIVVTVETDPSWVPVLRDAAAIVLERGGPLSHAAILARELGIPAVLSVPDATALLRDRLVTVDGSAGVVLLEEGDRG
jgi:pyruvate,water dikinase